MTATAKKYAHKVNELYFDRNGEWFTVDHRPWRQDKYTICYSVRRSTQFEGVWFERGSVYDGFSVVSDTPYAEFWEQSLIHDETRKTWTRIMSDAQFLFGMVQASFQIYKDLKAVGCDKKEAVKEMVRLLRRACIYFLGVSGVMGSIYIGLGRLKFWKQ